MTESLTKHERNIAAIIHAGTFSKFFIPFGNFIIPLVLWTANQNQYAFLAYHGKQHHKFQISLLLYSILVLIVLIQFLYSGFLPNIFAFDHVTFLTLTHLNL